MATLLDSSNGTLRVHRRLASKALGNQRDLAVWLPPGCDGRKRRYPVVYFQDGQNIFDPETAFFGKAWHAGDTAAELVRSSAIEPAILVGVYNTGADRIHEYAPTRARVDGPDGKPTRSRGRGKVYARFLINEVKPFIDARYPTLDGPANTALVGSSMGGLISLYGAVWHPQIFGSAALLSPSIWWDDAAPANFVRSLKAKPSVRLWLDTGTAEPGWERTRHFHDALVDRGWREGESGDLFYFEHEGAEHNEAAWAARTGPMLRWLLPRR